MSTSAFEVPGRGAWSRTGGLLPVRAGNTNPAGYYRLATSGETPVGRAYAMGTDTSHHAHAVWLGVRAIQNILDVRVDGIWGSNTSSTATAFQKQAGVAADGIVGPTTMYELLKAYIVQIAAAENVPPAVLAGLAGNESNFDPAAVGVNGADHGVAQINLDAHGDTVSLEQAMDPKYALTWSAKDLRRTYERWAGKTKADAWHVAIANHNSPRLAKQWAQTGRAPVVDGRPFQIEEYVQKVYAHPAAMALSGR